MPNVFSTGTTTSMKFSFEVPEFTSVNWPRIFSSGAAPETNCISRDSLLMA